MLLPALLLLPGHGMHGLARKPSPMASVARRPSCEPEWQHGGGTTLLPLCEPPPGSANAKPPSNQKWNAQTVTKIATNAARARPARALSVATSSRIKGAYPRPRQSREYPRPPFVDGFAAEKFGDTCILFLRMSPRRKSGDYVYSTVLHRGDTKPTGFSEVKTFRTIGNDTL